MLYSGPASFDVTADQGADLLLEYIAIVRSKSAAYAPTVVERHQKIAPRPAEEATCVVCLQGLKPWPRATDLILEVSSRGTMIPGKGLHP